MRTKATTGSLYAVLLLSATAILLTACGGPRVESTSIDGAVKSITNWEIQWAGDSTVTVDSTTLRWLTEKRSKYSQPEFCLEYIADIRQDLVSDHALPFYDNLPVTGYLEVTIDGVLRSLTVASQPTKAESLTAELTRTREPKPIDPFDRAELYRRNVDQVKRVQVRIRDRENRLLGEISIGGDEGSKVKPRDVAEAIARAIKHGRVAQPRRPD